MVDRVRPVAALGVSAVDTDTQRRGLGFGLVSIGQKTQEQQTRPGMSRPGFLLDTRELIVVLSKHYSWEGMDGNLKAAMVTVGATLILFSVAQVQHLEERIDQLEAVTGEASVLLELLREEQKRLKLLKCDSS